MHAPVSELWAAHEAGDDQWFWLHAGEGAAPTADQAAISPSTAISDRLPPRP